jgi:hypothetical protein
MAKHRLSVADHITIVKAPPLRRTDAATTDGIHIAIVLSLVFSLSAVAILSKRHLTNQTSFCILALALPMPIALYFRNRIVPLGVFTHVGALVIALTAAVLFGI